MSDKRFVIKVGRFGAYFYDNKLNKDVDMKETVIMLNEWASLNRLGNALEGYKR